MSPVTPSPNNSVDGPQTPSYDPYNPPSSPKSPSYSPNNPPQEKTKTIAEEKKEQDKEEMPLLNAVENKEGDDEDIMNETGVSMDGIIKKIN